jgi:hypothetical protein
MPAGVRTNNWSFNRWRNRLNAWLVAGRLRSRRSAAPGDAPLAQNRLEDEQQIQIERAQIHRHHSFHALPFAINAPPAACGKAYKAACRAAPRKRAMRVQPPSGEALQPPVRVASARRITMSIRRSIALFTLLLSLSAAPFVAANVPADSRPTRLSGRR